MASESREGFLQLTIRCHIVPDEGRDILAYAAIPPAGQESNMGGN